MCVDALKLQEGPGEQVEGKRLRWKIPTAPELPGERTLSSERLLGSETQKETHLFPNRRVETGRDGSQPTVGLDEAREAED